MEQDEISDAEYNAIISGASPEPEPFNKISPPLSRQISSRIVSQKKGDCFAHAVTNLFLKYFKTTYKNNDFFNDEKIHVTDNNNMTECDRLYLDMDNLYNCETKTCSLNDDLEQYCNEIELNSLLLYMFIYNLIVKKFGQDGGYEINCVQYVISKIYNKNFISRINSECQLKKKYCEIIAEFFLKNYDDRTLFINTKFMYFRIYNPLFKNKYFANTYNTDKDLFFSFIQKSINQNLYVSIGLSDIYFFLVYRHFKNVIHFLKNDRNLDLTHEQYNKIFKDFNNQYSDVSSEGHAMIIVDVDYSNNQNRKLLIKNSWGLIGESGFFYIHEKDIDYLNSFSDFSLEENITRITNKRYETSLITLVFISPKKTNDDKTAQIVRNLPICIKKDDTSFQDNTIITEIQMNKIFQFCSWLSFSSIFDCFGINTISKTNILEIFKTKIISITNYDTRFLFFVTLFKKMVQYEIHVNLRILIIFLRNLLWIIQFMKKTILNYIIIYLINIFHY